MSEPTELTAQQLLHILHEHAHAYLSVDPLLTPERAVRRAARLAVLAFDEITVEKELRAAAQLYNVGDLLALVIASAGGASQALSEPAPPPVESAA